MKITKIDSFNDLMLMKLDRQLDTHKVYATLKVPVEMRVWNGKHPAEDNMPTHMAPAGTKVRIWTVSRFGDVGITDNIVDPNGYDARVSFDILKDFEVV